MTLSDSFGLINIIDIGVILVCIYFFFSILKRTQIQNLSAILLVFIIGYSASQMIGLTLFSQFIEYFFIIFIVFIMIIFQNEIRRASEKIRRGKLFFSSQRFKL